MKSTKTTFPLGLYSSWILFVREFTIIYKDGAGASLHILVTAGFHRNYTNRLAEIISKKPVKSFVTTKELPYKDFVASRH
jgi:hypothetical protein